MRRINILMLALELGSERADSLAGGGIDLAYHGAGRSMARRRSVADQERQHRAGEYALRTPQHLLPTAGIS